MRYTVFQYHMSDDALNKLNSVGWGGDFGAYPELAIQRDVKFSGGSEGYSAWMSKYFVKVAEVEASDLDEVFHIGNGYGDQSKIQRVGERMHSVSVGDIIQTQDGYLWMVDAEGFECVGTNKIGEAA